MFLSSTSEVVVEGFGNDVSYVLPRRPLGKLRWFGIIPVLFSAGFISVPFTAARSLFHSMTQGNPPVVVFIMVAVAIGFVVAGAIPAGFGILLMLGRSRIDWRDGRLSVLDYAGQFANAWRMPRAPIVRLTVNIGPVMVNNKPVTSGPLSDLGALVAEFEQGKPRMVAVGYPQSWLKEIGDDLAAHMGATTTTVPPKVVVIDETKNPPELTDAERPAQTLVTLEQRGSGVAIEIPPAGVWRGSKGLLPFAIFWCLFMTAFTTVFFSPTRSRVTPTGRSFSSSGFFG